MGKNTFYSFEEVSASTMNRHLISFNSSAGNSTWDMSSAGNQYGMSGVSTAVIPMKLNSAVVSESGLSRGGTSSGSFVPGGSSGLKHDTGLAVEWSVEEQCTLERNLDKYKNEPSIMKYIRIAAALPDKTVRDVALRCNWMSRKRRKQDEHSGKKVTNRKEKVMESCPKPSLTSAQTFNLLTVTCSPMMHQLGQSGLAPSHASYDTVKQFLQQTSVTFDQISANMRSLKFHENIELFCRTKKNITTALNEMGQLPGFPRLPVSINEDLINCIVPASADGGWTS